MLGGLQSPDRELIRSWMQRDWADNLYPGATNAEGRRLLEEHLAAMFDLETEQQPLVELDGRLIKQAQNSLARLSVSQRAYEFLKSEARVIDRWRLDRRRRGGPDMAVVFETTTGQPLDAVRVPEFFTYNGFQQKLRRPAAGIVGADEEGALGAGRCRPAVGHRPAVRQSGRRPARTSIPTNSSTTWRTALGQLAPEEAARRQAEIRGAAGAFGADLADAANPGIGARRDGADQGAAEAGERSGASCGRAGTGLFTNAQDGPPGATIEAQFKPYHAVLEGDSTRRPIDSTIAQPERYRAEPDVDDRESPTDRTGHRCASDPGRSAAQQCLAHAAAILRHAARAAAEFEGNIAASTAGQILQTLRDQVTPVCQQTVTNRYPFVRSSDQEVPLADFAKLFSPNGVMDKFFTQYLAPYADTSKSDWAWRKESPVGRSFSPDTLKQFQNAAYIRDAFFQTGGSVPAVSFAIRPPGRIRGPA